MEHILTNLLSWRQVVDLRAEPGTSLSYEAIKASVEQHKPAVLFLCQVGGRVASLLLCQPASLRRDCRQQAQAIKCTEVPRECQSRPHSRRPRASRPWALQGGPGVGAPP